MIMQRSEHKLAELVPALDEYADDWQEWADEQDAQRTLSDWAELVVWDATA